MLSLKQNISQASVTVTKMVLLFVGCLLLMTLLQQGFVSAQQLNHKITGNSTKVASLKSYQCTNDEIKFQFENIDRVSPHICEPFGMMTPWQLVQMIYPDIRTFIDVGANRGYTAAEFFGLWSPGHGFNRINLFKSLSIDASRKLLSNTEQLNTYCKDGEKEDKPLICVGRHNAPCLTRRQITVYSFDGQKTHVEDTNGTVARHFPHLMSNYSVDPTISSVKATWVYTRAAMTDVIDPGVTHGYFKVVGHEGGQLIKSQKDAAPGTDLVPLMTVDMFCEQHKLNHVPVLKIDAEGHDIEVLNGAKQTMLIRNVKVVSLECWNCMLPTWQNTFHSLDVEFGFDCYVIGEYNLFARITNCWDYSVAKKAPECTEATNKNCPEFIKYYQPSKRLDGNIMCIHRKRGSRLHAMFEQMSLYKHQNTHLNGDPHKDALLSNLKASFDKKGRIVGSPNDIAAYLRRTGRDFKTGAKVWENKR